MTAGRRVNTLSQSWCTPHKYVNAIKRFWGGHIALDPCSNEYSVVNADREYLLPDNDGLKDSWEAPTIYVNPPYGADKDRGTTIKNWLARCVMANEEYGSEVIALIPVAPNTSHWKNFIFGKASAICFLYDTRLKFLENGLDSGKGAPMACCLVYWGAEYKRFFDNFIEFGAVINLSDLKSASIGDDYFYQTLKFDTL